MKKYLYAGIALLFITSYSPAADLLLEYKFNETGNYAANSGTLSDSLEFRSAATGSPLVDAHGADGSGVTGKAGDKAFDNSAATMGGNGYVGRTAGDVDAVDQLVSFTISAWYKTAGTTSLVGSNARFLLDYATSPTTNGWQLLGNNNATPGLFAYMDNVSVNMNALSGTVLAQTETWVFIAMTYDGTLTSNNLKLYGGTKTNGVTLLDTRTVNSGALEDNAEPFLVGNSSDRTRAFSGFIDNVRLHGTKTAGDNSGVLDLAALEKIRMKDINPPALKLMILTQ